MTEYLYLAGTLAACIAVIVLIMRAGDAALARRRNWIEEFRQRWPDRCPICSYWRYGFFSGQAVGNEPPPHSNCPERKKVG